MLFIYSFYAMCGLCAFIYFYTRAKLSTSEDPQFLSFQRSYLVVYLMAVGKRVRE